MDKTLTLDLNDQQAAVRACCVPVDISALQSVWPLTLEMKTGEASFLVYQSGRATVNWSLT